MTKQMMKKPTRFFVQYNCKTMGVYKTLRGALKLILRKGWVNDYDNDLWLVDNNGDSYHTTLGYKLKGIL